MKEFPWAPHLSAKRVPGGLLLKRDYGCAEWALASWVGQIKIRAVHPSQLWIAAQFMTCAAEHASAAVSSHLAAHHPGALHRSPARLDRLSRSSGLAAHRLGFTNGP